MATRSFIWMKDGQKWRGIYCHFDGYPEGVGATLRRHYTSAAKIKELIDLGFIESLEPDIDATVAYHRDYGEKWSRVAPKVADSVKDALDVTFDIGDDVEYVYFWDGKQWNCYRAIDGKWMFGRDPEPESESRYTSKSTSTRALLEIVRSLHRLEKLLD